MTPQILAKSIVDLIRSDLQTIRASHFAWLIAATAVVLIGVCLEGPEAILAHPKHWAKRLGRTGWLLIVLGLAGEGAFEMLVSSADASLGDFKDILMFATQREAENAGALSTAAQQRASEADERTSINEREAAKLRERAEAEKLERLKLEAFVSPRVLTIDQRQRIATAVNRFGTRTIVVSSYGQDEEGFLRATQIVAVLRAAGISVIDERASTIVSGGFISGVNVRGHLAEEKFVVEVVQALRTIGDLRVTINGPPVSPEAMDSGGVLIRGGPIAFCPTMPE